MSETIPELKIDKSAWGDGPWQTEPDRVQWQHAGYACLMVRHPQGGHWCGYVGVDRAHPYYGGKASECDVDPPHGTVNYAEACEGYVCHVPEPGMPADVWWIGFDANHLFDFAPGLMARAHEAEARSPELAEFAARERELEKECPQLKPTYRTLAYMKHQTEALAEQLREKAAVSEGRKLAIYERFFDPRLRYTLEEAYAFIEAENPELDTDEKRAAFRAKVRERFPPMEPGEL